MKIHVPWIVRFWTMQGRAAIPALVLVAILCSGSGASRGAPLHVAVAIRETDPAANALALSPCPPRMLPDGDICVRLPEDDDGAREPESEQSGDHDTRGRWTAYDEIPRRPDRPADYDAYRYPVPCNRDCVAGGGDLDRPGEMQPGRRHASDGDWIAPRTPRKPAPRAALGGRAIAGGGAVDLPQKKGTPVVTVDLEHQQGDAEVIYVGPLFGTTIITRHTLREAGQLRDYLLLFGHLDAQSPAPRAGTRIKEGEILGLVGEAAPPELDHLHLEARRVRTGVDVGKLAASAMIANENSVVCDPRNVLPLKRSP
jgi:murein DD-endopeptidase MepM/ murein hydrolase activator NlpD